MYIISIYDHAKHSSNGTAQDIDVFFSNIKNGNWKSKVEKIRILKYNFLLESDRLAGLSNAEKNKDEKYLKAKLLLQDEKNNIHRITVGGKFGVTREEINLTKPSGLIDIDIDGIRPHGELLDLKNKLIKDEYCYACFISCGGDGLSFIARIDPLRFGDSFDGLQEYFFKNYGISLDRAHRNVANTRNASYDPDIFVSQRETPIFKKYIKPVKKKEVPNNFVHVQNDFESIIKEICHRKIDFCPSYDDYRSVGFAIASQYGSQGLEYFKSVCQYGAAYNEDSIERDYKYFCREKSGGIKIGTFYFRCKEFNIETSSKETAKIASSAYAAFKGGRKKEDTIANLVKFDGYTKEQVEGIVTQVFEDKVEFFSSESILDDIEAYIKQNYSLVKNSLTGMLECDGKEWSEEELNGMYIAIKKVYEKADQKWIERIIFSPFIKQYNPLHKFFEENLDLLPDELLKKGEIPSIIKRLWRSVKTHDPVYLEQFGTKWLVSVVSAAYGQRSDLELDFAGGKNEGKTYFFANILPPELQKYYAESDLDKDKDDEILMCHKLIILMNECGGKTREDVKKHKKMLDSTVFSLRRPYRKNNEDIKRLAVICGTSNNLSLLSDTTGNRRIIPVNVLSRDQDEYDAIDKKRLWMAAYYLYKQGFKWKITKEDNIILDKSSLPFQDYGVEYELITKYYSSDAPTDFVTATDVKVFLDNKSNLKLKLSSITNELRRLGFEQQNVTFGNITKMMYKVRYLVVDSQASRIVPEKDYF
jgi:hypothetical protein